MQRSLEPTRPLARVKGIVCSLKKRGTEKIAKKDLTGPTLLEISGYPRGPRVACETTCPKHTAPNKPAETLSRTKVSREPDGHRQRRSPGWSGLDQRHSSWNVLQNIPAFICRQ